MLIIGGTTASGKSALAVKLAKILDGEVVSADSMQIYKGMDIGTAKITEEEACGVRHYLIDVVNPDEEFSVAQYQKLALEAVENIESRGKTAVIAGGTGLYINSLIYPLSFGNAYKNDELRQRLNDECSQYGNSYIYDKLVSIDPEAAEKIHVNNTKRIIRAIEVKMLSGSSVSGDNLQKKPQRYYKMYALNTEREELYRRINLRVDKMLADGLEGEVKKLLEAGYNFDMQSMQAIGYKEFKEYFAGETGRESLIETIKRHSRNYAKRQITWFKAYKDCIWLEPPVEETRAEELAAEYLNGKAENGGKI